MTEPFVLWFTGLSGSGKSTLAAMMTAELRMRGVAAQRIDGDEIRATASRDLGFSRADRDENVRRLGVAAALSLIAGRSAVVAAMSPYRGARDEVRRAFTRFAEVHVACELSELVRRDPKGLYRRALEGRLPGLSGFNAIYEEPVHPEIRVDTTTEPPDRSFARILDRLDQLHLI